jgi:hypothetical protein
MATPKKGQKTGDTSEGTSASDLTDGFLLKEVVQ